MNKIKILIVEDESIIALDIKESLKILGYDVTAVVSTAEKALEKVSEIHPDLVLMDIMLKGEMDGIEAADRLRKLYNIPVVYLTAHTDAKTLERAKNTEPFGYIVKPFEERDIHTTVEMALARAKAETEIRNALQKEKELSELKSRFVSMVSHEFRTPMSTILFSASLLEKYGHKWTEEKKTTHLHRIQDAIQQMTHLLDSVLAIGQAEAGKLEFKPVSIDLEKICRELVEELQHLANDKIRISFVCQGVCDRAQMDEQLLRHILCNLLSNAIKYSSEGKEVQFELTCQSQGEGRTENGEVAGSSLPSDVAIFRIQDEGIGISLEDQKHLFETFYRGTNVGTISGTGLGLAIVKKSVDLHGGEISCCSDVGVGTTFTVILPLYSSSR